MAGMGMMQMSKMITPMKMKASRMKAMMISAKIAKKAKLPK